MSTALIRPQENMDIAQLNELGGIFAKSGYFKDVKEAAQAAVKIMYGRELGFSPVVSMMGIHVIEGKPALSANLMAGMIKRSGRYNYRVAVLTDTECRLTFIEAGVDVGESSFTIADAKKAGVVRSGGSWEKYPRNMMFARALSNGLKLYCPDLSMCPLYNPEEMGAEVTEEGDVVSLPASSGPTPKVTVEPRTFGRPTAVELQKFNEEHPPVVTEAPPVPSETATEYIDRPRQVNFARAFREALPKALQHAAEKIRHEWLATNKFIDKDGNPSSTVIPLAAFEEVKSQAVKFAGEQQ